MSVGFECENYDFQYRDGIINSELLWESHCHARYEMISVLEGDVTIMLEGRDYRLTAKQTAILPPLVYHTVRANKKGRYSRVTVLFDIEAVSEVLRERFEKRKKEAVIFYSHGTEELKKLCLSGDHGYYLPLAKALMTVFFYEYANTKGTGASANVNEDLREMLEYIDEHLCERITLEDIALHTARSRSSVSHLFAEKMGITPKQYILQKKMALASKLIGAGTPPTVAAARIGYDNYSDFYRIYRKQTGRSPSEALSSSALSET